MLSRIKTLRLLTLFSILSSAACASGPKTTKFDGKWQFCEIVPQKQLACLDEDDVQKLRQLLIECQNKKP